MVNKKIFLILSVLVVVFLSACGKKEGEEPTKYRSQSGLEKLTRQATNKATQQSTVKNSKFFVSNDISGKADQVRDLDSQIRPVLKRLFGDARLVSESNGPQTQRDGEVVENKFTYVVSKVLVRKDGKLLHTALHAAGFGLSPRLGSEPTTWSGGAMMSLFKSTSLRSYSLVVNIDIPKQQIVVESYQLGSKYDRLM